jgi:hypothetical protein
MSFRGASRGRGTGANFGGGGGRGGGGFGARGGQQFESHTVEELLIYGQGEVDSSKETMGLQPTFLVRTYSARQIILRDMAIACSSIFFSY